MIRPLLLLITGSLLSSACSPADSVSLKEFGEISVSDPRVVDNQLKVDVLNETGHELCYFEDGLFYGPNAIEGSSGTTELRPGAAATSLEEIKHSTTGRYDYSVKQINQGRGQISIKITMQAPLSSGDDIFFDIIFCDVERDGRYKTLGYQSRLN